MFFFELLNIRSNRNRNREKYFNSDIYKHRNPFPLLENGESVDDYSNKINEYLKKYLRHELNILYPELTAQNIEELIKPGNIIPIVQTLDDMQREQVMNEAITESVHKYVVEAIRTYIVNYIS